MTDKLREQVANLILDWDEVGEDVGELAGQIIPLIRAECQKVIGEEMISRSIAGFSGLPKDPSEFWKGYWQAYNDKGASLAKSGTFSKEGG